MQRIRVPGGRLGAGQLRAIAGIAARYTPGTGLHVTTRQDIELHNVREGDIEAVQTELNENGLVFLGAGGDSLRNVTVCAMCGKCAGGEVYGVALKMEEYLNTLAFIKELPRKFKVSFSGCEQGCARPYINDLGFVRRVDGKFDVIGAGSLGARPATGIMLFSGLPEGQAEAFCIAAVEMFFEMGDRTNRRAARLRHVRQRLGDEQFSAELRARFEAVLKREAKAKTGGASGAGKSRRVGVLNLPNGNISEEEAILLADAAETAGARIYINLDHGFELYGERAVEMGEELLKYSSMARIVACPGAASCPNGITNSTAMGDLLREVLRGTDTGDKAVRISACPNDCAQCAVAGIGLIGVMRTINGVRQECYRVMAGGDEGRTGKMATETAVLPMAEAGQYLKGVL